MNRKILSLFSLLALALTSCGSEAKKIAQVFIFDETDPFMISLSKSLNYIFQGTVESNFKYAERNQNTQNSQIIEALKDPSTKILVLNMVDRLAASAIIELAYKKNVPVVFINREPLKSDLYPTNTESEDAKWIAKNCYYVGSDAKSEGLKQAEIADSYFVSKGGFASSSLDKNGDGKIQIGLLKGEEGHQDSEERSKYCIQGLTEKGYAVDLVSTAYANWDAAQAEDKMATFPIDTIELLYSNNDAMAIGASNYLIKKLSDPEKSILDAFFPIIGVDGTKDGKVAVDQHRLLGTVTNDNNLQASIIYRVVAHFIFGSDLPEYFTNTTTDGRYFYVSGGIYNGK